VAEARLSLQEQAQIIRGSMDGAAHELTASLQELKPLLRELQSASTLGTVLGEELGTLKASMALRRAIEQLSGQLLQLEQLQREQLEHSKRHCQRQSRWPWN
jgi:hypothetical protein